MTQYNSKNKEYLNTNKTIYEVVMVADSDGNVINPDTPQTINISENFLDAFGKLRVSSPYTLADYKHTYGDVGDFITLTENGGGVTHPANKAHALLETSANANSRVVYQSKIYHHYLPGKSNLVYTSFSFDDSDISCKKRIGYFDDNNGIFLEKEINELGEYVLKLVIRSNVSGVVEDVVVTQENWNKDTCDGNGASLFEIDTTKTQLIFFDFQWLGVGRVRCGFFHEGSVIFAHDFYHSNITSEVYWSNPNLPVRSEIINTGESSASFKHICSTVVSEGGYVEAGTDWEQQSSQMKPTELPGGTWTPILAIRLKNTFKGDLNRVVVAPENLSVFSDLNTVAYKVGKIPSADYLSNGLPLSWNSVHENSAVEYCEEMTEIDLGQFESFAGGFVVSGNPQSAPTAANTADVVQSKRNKICQNYDSTDSEVYVLIAKTLTTGNNDYANVVVSMQWKEII